MIWLLQSIELWDVVDIALMTFILYRTLLIIRGTRAVQSLAGLFVLMVVYVIADWLQLMSINWLLQQFFEISVLALIILFQEDIRRGLARAGGRFVLQGRKASDLPLLEEVVRASYAMAARRMGAIIAIERGGSLDEYVDSATALDAQVSQSLLLSVFHPTSPLHDGAVVIQKGRMACAQAFLPLTQSKSVSKFLGTRHRAAIGLTETTDAIVVVVSEERGVVSICHEGRLHTTTDANDLRQELQTLFQVDDAVPAPSPNAAEA